MKKAYLMLVAIVFMVCAAAPTVWGQSSQTESVLVGHIDYLEGRLLRYVPETKDWVATVKDAPFGLQDALYSDPDCRAEIIMPNSTMLRIGGSTQAQMLRLAKDSTEIDIASGKARFYSTGAAAAIRATTPFGQVVAPAGAVFDLYVGDESLEVIAIKETIEYVHPSGTTKYPVQPGAPSIIASRTQVTAGQGLTDSAWNSWNVERDQLWQQRSEPRGDTARYVPQELYTETYALEESGRWETVRYEGFDRNFWRPTHVSAGWSPYTCGHWTYWYGDQCWIPDEPFGYVTHHYGTWVYVDSAGCWYWAPPAAAGVVAVPSYTIGYGWYPGRVSWIYSDDYVGWVPLAPYEPYYCNNYWGPAVIIVYDDDDHDHHHGDHDGGHHGDHGGHDGRHDDGHGGGHDDGHGGGHKYDNHAVVVPQNSFYNAGNYIKAGLHPVDKATVQKAYRGSPVVNSMVIKNYKNQLQRYNFADINVRQKPHQTVRDRIEQNLAASKREGRQPVSELKERLDRMKTGTPAPASGLQSRPQQVTDKLVPAGDVAKPRSSVSFPTHELKPTGAVRPSQTDITAQPKRPPQQAEQPVKQPDREVARPATPQPERIQPSVKDTNQIERPRPPGFNKPDQDESARPGLKPDRDNIKTEPKQPERYQRPETDTDRIERPKPPVFNRPDQKEVQPPMHHEPQVEQPRTIQPPVHHEPQVEQPRTIQPPVHHEPQVEQPRTIQPPVHHEPQVEQPRTMQPPVHHEPQVEQPRQIEQPTYSRPETHAPVQTHTEQPSSHHQQSAPQPSSSPSQTPTNTQPGYRR